jgi:regulator of replication initiation timing
MKHSFQTFSFFVFLAIIYLTFSCGVSQSEFDDMQSELSAKVDSCEKELQAAKDRAEELKEENDRLGSDLISLREKQKEPAYTEEQKAVMKLVYDLQESWENLPKTKDIDSHMGFFTSKFYANRVVINTGYQSEVDIMNREQFREYLEQALENDFELEFGKARFYTVHVQGNIFTTSYHVEIEVKVKGEVVQRNVIKAFISGGEYDGKLLIGSYNWVNYQYFDVMKGL